MADYLYDGSFQGLLCCIFAHYYEEKASGIFMEENYQPSLITKPCQIKTEPHKAQRVYEAIQRKISPIDLQRIYSVFLSCEQDKEIKILQYIVLGFREGSKIGLLYGNPVVAEVCKIERRVHAEVHRLLGLIRFSVLQGDVLYASIEPDHDIVELLQEHFGDRFKNDPFIIHDAKRGKALIAQGGQWYVSDFDQEFLPGFSEDEETCRTLWKQYFGTIAIKERTNARCQKNFMPVRYWKNLTEMQ